MQEMVGWVKNYSMVYLFFTVLMFVVAKKEYRRYVQVFVELVLVITLVSPILKISGKESSFFEKISYDAFWQELNNIKTDQQKIDFIDTSAYLRHYEKVISEDVKNMAEAAGYEVLETDVTLGEEFEVENILLRVVKNEEHPVIKGSINAKTQDSGVVWMQEEIASYYQMETEQIQIID